MYYTRSSCLGPRWLRHECVVCTDELSFWLMRSCCERRQSGRCSCGILNNGPLPRPQITPWVAGRRGTTGSTRERTRPAMIGGEAAVWELAAVSCWRLHDSRLRLPGGYSSSVWWVCFGRASNNSPALREVEHCRARPSLDLDVEDLRSTQRSKRFVILS